MDEELKNAFAAETAQLKHAAHGDSLTHEQADNAMLDVTLREEAPIVQLPTEEEYQTKPFARLVYSYYQQGKRDVADPVVFRVIAEGPSKELPEQTWLLQAIGLRVRQYIDAHGVELHLLRREGPAPIDKLQYTTPDKTPGSSDWGLFPAITEEELLSIQSADQFEPPELWVRFHGGRTEIVIENAARLSLSRLQASFPKIIREVQKQRREQVMQAMSLTPGPGIVIKPVEASPEDSEGPVNKAEQGKPAVEPSPPEDIPTKEESQLEIDRLNAELEGTTSDDPPTQELSVPVPDEHQPTKGESWQQEQSKAVVTPIKSRPTAKVIKAAVR